MKKAPAETVAAVVVVAAGAAAAAAPATVTPVLMASEAGMEDRPGTKALTGVDVKMAALPRG